MASPSALSSTTAPQMYTIGYPHILDPELQVRIVGSKADRATDERRHELEGEAGSRGLAFLGWVSVRTGEGLEAWVAWLKQQASKTRRA